MEDWRFAVVATYPVDVEVGLDAPVMADVERLFESGAADAMLLAGPVGPAVAEWVSDVALAHASALWAVMPTEIPGTASPRVIWPGSAPLLQIVGQRRPVLALAAKRAVDVAGALIGLALSAPVLLLLAAFVWLESPGAPFFMHMRVGRGGRLFNCLKLRTMFADAEARLESDALLLGTYRENNYKIPDDSDPRVTRLGRLLRRASLDELPQLWNVLTGDMSLVGPRPVVPSELEHYVGARRRLMLSMRPGLTGAWAVSGRHAIGYPERAAVELAYVRGWSLRKDALILAKTVTAVLTY